MTIKPALQARGLARELRDRKAEAEASLWVVSGTSAFFEIDRPLKIYQSRIYVKESYCKKNGVLVIR